MKTNRTNQEKRNAWSVDGQFTASELRARIQKQVFSHDAAGCPTMVWDGGRLESAERSKQAFPSLLQSAEDERREELNQIVRHEGHVRIERIAMALKCNPCLSCESVAFKASEILECLKRAERGGQ